MSGVKYHLTAIGQHYRDCCDCRVCEPSGFDELKNPWRWGEFTRVEGGDHDQVTAAEYI